jgi:hypothetical protein
MPHRVRLVDRTDMACSCEYLRTLYKVSIADPLISPFGYNNTDILPHKALQLPRLLRPSEWSV